MPLTTQKQKASYSIGLDIGDTFKKQEMDLDAAALAKGIQDALSGSKRLMTEKESWRVPGAVSPGNDGQTGG